MAGNGNRSGGAEARATEGTRSPVGGAGGSGRGLPAGVGSIESSTGSRVYSFSQGGKNIVFSVSSQGDVNFSVGGTMSRGGLQGREADRAALTVMRIFKHDVSTRPNGFKYETSAYIGDGYGIRRAEIYQRAGFSKPAGDTPGDKQYGIVRGGKLVPDNGRRRAEERRLDQEFAEMLRQARGY